MYLGWHSCFQLQKIVWANAEKEWCGSRLLSVVTPPSFWFVVVGSSAIIHHRPEDRGRCILLTDDKEDEGELAQHQSWSAVLPSPSKMLKKSCCWQSTTVLGATERGHDVVEFYCEATSATRESSWGGGRRSAQTSDALHHDMSIGKPLFLLLMSPWMGGGAGVIRDRDDWSDGRTQHKYMSRHKYY